MAGLPSFFKGDFVINNRGCEGFVVDYVNARKVLVEFLDDNGYRGFFEASDLREGVFKNPYIPTVEGVGYLGVGEHKSRVNGKICKVYKVWSGMLTRCYTKNSRSKWASYGGCTVHKDWHNYQNFAEWYKNQKFYDAGYHLDKDILVKGNKVYGPDTCCLVPEAVNLAVRGGYGLNNPDEFGAYLDKRIGKYSSRISMFGKELHLGMFDKPEDASKAFKKAKKHYMKCLADVYKESIDEEVYLALSDWGI